VLFNSRLGTTAIQEILQSFDSCSHGLTIKLMGILLASVKNRHYPSFQSRNSGEIYYM